MLARIKLLFPMMMIALALTSGVSAASPSVYIAEVDGVINPAAADYIKRAIAETESQGGQALVLVLNTPGGLIPSTWEIGEAILNARVPVIVYVGPAGAYAGSAGVFITYASHVAVMAPNTNIGSAHPVGGGGEDLGEDMRDKVTNDAVARITTWARSRERNEEWAEKSVRESASIGSDDALEMGVIDLIAVDLPDLLRQLDGRSVALAQGSVVLRTADAPTTSIGMTVLEELLHIIADPNIATLLISLGTMALFYEIVHPGLTVAGLLGGVSILLGLYGINVLPVNYAGLALLVFAFVLFGIDIFATNHGALTLGGVVSFVVGAMLLFNNAEAPGVQVSRWLIAGMGLAMAAASALLIYLMLLTRRRRSDLGQQGLIGRIAQVRSPLSPNGMVFVDGALWKARADEPATESSQVQVVGVEGLTLVVRPHHPQD